MYNCVQESAFPGYPFTYNKYYPTQMYVPTYAYPEALKIIADSVRDEREDEAFYSYLLSIAPQAQKEIIMEIINDERKHGMMLREIYWQVTGQDLPPSPEVPFERPNSYCEGITKAIFGELTAVERYRMILFGFEFLPYRNMLTEIYTDELKHASKWNYLFALNCR